MNDPIEPGVSKRVETVALILGAGFLVVLSFGIAALAALAWAYRPVGSSILTLFAPYILIELVIVGCTIWFAFKNNYWFETAKKIGAFLAMVMLFAIVFGAFLKFVFDA